MKKGFACLIGLLLVIAMASQAAACTWTIDQSFDNPGLGARGQDEKALSDSGLDRVDTPLGKEICLGDPNYGNTLQSALAAIGSSPALLLVPQGTWSIAGNLTIPANVSLRVEQGAILSLSNNAALTINGKLQAGPYKIFSGSGTVSLGSPKAVADPEWWGVTGTADNVAIQAALNAAPIVRLQPTTYNLTGTIVIPSNRELIGSGPSTIVHESSTLNYAFDIYNVSNIKISNIKFTGSEYYTSSGCATIWGASAGTNSNVVINNCWFDDVNGTAITAGGAHNWSISNCYINGTGEHGIYCSLADGVTITNVSVQNTNFTGFKIKSSTNIYVTNCIAQNCLNNSPFVIEADYGYPKCSYVYLSNCTGIEPVANGYYGLFINGDVEHCTISGGHFSGFDSILVTGNSTYYPTNILFDNVQVGPNTSQYPLNIVYGDEITIQGGKYEGATNGYAIHSETTAGEVNVIGATVRSGYGIQLQGATGSAVVPANSHDIEHFNLTDGELQGLVLQQYAGVTPPTPTLTIDYSGLTTSATVTLNSVLLGSLDPTQTTGGFQVPESILVADNIIDIFNPGSSFNISGEIFDTGGIDTNPTSVPPTVLLLGSGLLGLVGWRSFRKS